MNDTHSRPALTADVVVFRYRGGWLELLLIQRKSDPFEGQWALPGGFVEPGEDPIDGARRELSEETGVEGIPLLEVGTFARPGRDPRGWVASVAFLALAPSDTLAVAGDDARITQWHRLAELPNLAFDHGSIVEQAVEQLRQRTQIDTTVLMLLPPIFRSRQARELYSQIWKKRIKPTQFKAWLRRRGVVERVGPARFKRSDALHNDWLR